MSNQQNDELREGLFEEATDIVELQIKNGEVKAEDKDKQIDYIAQSLWEERDFSIEDQMDDNSGDEYWEAQLKGE
jgi:hypothetical protein